MGLKIAVLEEGMKYTPISISPDQAQFLETRKFQINEIARIFRVPPPFASAMFFLPCRKKNPAAAAATNTAKTINLLSTLFPFILSSTFR